MTHREYLAKIKAVMGEYVNNFQPRPNTFVVIGLSHGSSRMRHIALQDIARELRDLKIFKSVNIQSNITLPRTTATNSIRVRRQSSAKIIVADTGTAIPYVIMLKPAHDGNYTLDPKQFKIEGKDILIREYTPTVYEQIITSNLPEDVILFLQNLVMDVHRGGFTQTGNKLFKTASKETQLFFNDTSFKFIANVNKQFGEVLAPYVVEHDSDLKKARNVKIFFPTSGIMSGKDFSVTATINGEVKTFDYSVKTGHTVVVNTVKSSDLLVLLSGKTIPVKLQKEYAIIENLANLSAENGVAKVAELMGHTEKVDTQDAESLQTAITYIEKESQGKKYDFTGLLALAIQQRLTFIKFTYTNQHQIIFDIIKDEQVSQLQRGSINAISLRGKGFKGGSSKMQAKLGLTPP
jgi:hypothetical protein